MRTLIRSPFIFDRPLFDKWIKLDRYGEAAGELTGELEKLLDEVLPLVKPRILMREVKLSSVGEREIILDECRFDSAVLAWNLKKTDRIWVYVVSCGREIYERLTAEEDPLRNYWIDALAEMAVQSASDYLGDYLNERFAPAKGSLTYMNPGSADRDVWNIDQQAELFKLIGNVDEIGVTLTSGSLMEPSKSLSGFYFASPDDFVSCWVCSQSPCHTRLAAYREDFHKSFSC